MNLTPRHNVTTWRPMANILKYATMHPTFFFRHRANLLRSQMTIFVIIHVAKTALVSQNR